MRHFRDGGHEAVTDTTLDLEPVDLDTVAWFTEGRHNELFMPLEDD